MSNSIAQQILKDRSGERESFLDRARENAKLTIPHLMLPTGHSHSSQVSQPWESTGGFLLNNLTNKIAQSLFPAGLPWIRFELVPRVQQQIDTLADAERERLSQQISATLSRLERENFTRQVSKDGDAAVLIRCIRQLLVAGNYCIQSLDSGRIKGRTLPHFVTERDGEGTVTSAVISDLINFNKLDQDVQNIVINVKFAGIADMAIRQSTEDIQILTYIKLMPDGRYEIYQEAVGEEIPGTRKTYSMETMPYFFPTYELFDGENFGRSYVETYLGDLESLDAQSEIVQRGTSAAAKFIRLVKAGAEVSKQAFSAANTGDILTGREGDISTVQANKSADFQASLTVQDRIISRLNAAFLRGVGNIRNAERVTAAEVQFIAQELEQQLGSAYTELVRNLQLPHASLKIRRMQKNGSLPSFNLDQIDVTVLTGAAALTRQSKVTAMINGLQPLANLAPDALRAKLDIDTLVNLMSEGIGYSYAGILLSEEEVTRRRREQLSEQVLAKQLQNPQQQPGQEPTPQPTQPAQ